LREKPLSRPIGDTDLEQDLLRPGDADHVDDAGIGFHEAPGDQARVLGGFGRADFPGQDDVAVDGADGQFGSGEEFGQRLAQGRQVLFDPDVHLENPVALLVQEERVGIPGLQPDHISVAGRLDHDVGDGRIRDQDVAGIARQVDVQGLGGRQLDRPVAGHRGRYPLRRGRPACRDRAQCQSHGQEDRGGDAECCRSGEARCRHQNDCLSEYGMIFGLSPVTNS
jgi:hypothetical protein